jgi:hypothetical protein
MVCLPVRFLREPLLHILAISFFYVLTTYTEVEDTGPLHRRHLCVIESAKEEKEVGCRFSFISSYRVHRSFAFVLRHTNLRKPNARRDGEAIQCLDHGAQGLVNT